MTTDPPPPSGRPRPGLNWAFVMLALQAFECLVLVEVVFFDRPGIGLGSGFNAVQLYFALVAFTVLLQIAGIVLVLEGRYRAGGALQIASSAIHVLKGEGVVGLIGGLKAYRYSRPAE